MPAPIKIVILDGHTLNPGDLSWGGVQALGKCQVYERSTPLEVLKRADKAEAILVNKVIIDRNLMLHLPRLKYIGVTATGVNVIDLQAARERGILVTNVPNYGARSVAQMTLALLLELTQHVGHHAATAREGRWTASPDFCYWDYPLIELDGLTLGIVGLGHIGRQVAELAAAFGMRLLVHTPRQPENLRFSAERVDLNRLFRESDVVSLHCPLTPETKNLVNTRRLSLMKRSAFLLNTSRGGLVADYALAEALNAGRIAGAGLDVLSIEPPSADHPLLHARNCLVTPHIAWATRAARSRLMDMVVANLRAYLNGQPQNAV